MHRFDDVSPGRQRGLIVGSMVALGCSLVLAARPAQYSQDTVGESVELTRSSLEEMVATKRLIAKEKREWAVDQELLKDRIELVQGQIDSLRASIGQAATSAEEAQRKYEELKAEDAGLAAASAGLAEIVGGLELRTKELLVHLPGPIVETVRPLSQALPTDPTTSEASLTDRFPRLLGILNQVGKFGRDMHSIPERVELETGETANVTALYLGFARAYYATADGAHAGTGHSTAEGWVWTPELEAADAASIAHAIAIYEKSAPAGFARVPLTIQ